MSESDFSPVDDDDARALARILSGSPTDPTDQGDRAAMARAEADIERIRTALRTIGDQVGMSSAATIVESPTTAHDRTSAPTGDLAPVQRSRPRSRRWLPATAIGTVAAALIVWFAGSQFGNGVPANTPGTTRPSTGAPQAQLSYAGAVACSRFVAEGKVITVKDGAKPGRVSVSFDVQRWYKPAREPGQVTFDVPDPAAEGATPRWQPGEHLLVMVSTDPNVLMSTYPEAEIAETRAQVEKALPEAAAIDCPTALLPVS